MEGKLPTTTSKAKYKRPKSIRHIKMGCQRFSMLDKFIGKVKLSDHTDNSTPTTNVSLLFAQKFPFFT